MPNDRGKVARALDTAGIAYRTREVLIVRIPDEPGTLGDKALVMSQAGGPGCAPPQEFWHKLRSAPGRVA